MTSPKEPALAAPDFRGFARFGYLSVAVVCGGFIIWSAMAPLGGAAIAPARVSVESESKPVQHLEGGIVREILVKEAQAVEEGEVLFRLEPVLAQANADLLQKQLDAAFAQDARLGAERDGAKEIVFPEELLVRRHIPEVATIMADQRIQLSQRMSAMRSELGIYTAKLQQTSREISGRKARLAADEAQVTSYSSEIAALMPLYKKQLVTAPRMRGLERERDRLTGEIGMTKSDIERLEQSMEETQLQLEQARQRQRETVLQQLAEGRARISDVKEKLAIASDVLKRVEVRAPRKGIVQALKVHGIGTVVKPGETMAEVVPVGDSLILAAHVSPLNIQDVGAGQSAEVRFVSLGKNAPPMFGRVESVSADTLLDEATRQPYYLARVRMDHGAVPRELASKLMPGMPADVLISTGERTMLQYLLSPLATRLAKSMRES
jgi:membrane fusion protein, type I secretion system